MAEEFDQLIQKLWQDYAVMNKQAKKIHKALQERGEHIVNDHIAFRTFNLPEVSIDVLAEPFVRLGYELKGDGYHFKEKKLLAKHYEHPQPGKPKIFISALKVEECSQKLQKVVCELVDQLPKTFVQDPERLILGAPWKKITCQTYQDLLHESEYAAWMAVFGFRVNHFTVFVNELRSFKSMEALNTFIKELGFKLNDSGGEIKGSEKVYLEQSSTLAYPVEIEFSDKKMTIPGCYYEFAKRYPRPDGNLFQGFLPESADKIFESTHVRRK